MPITTTLNRIRAHLPCSEGWTKLLAHLGKTRADDEPLAYATILESNGIDDALWCCRAEPDFDRTWRRYAVWCARQVQHLMDDPRSLRALDVAEAWCDGKASDEELQAAWAWAEIAVRDAAGAAAREAAGEAAWYAAWEAAWYAACAAREAVGADAAREAAGDAAREAAGDAQAQEFLRIVS